MQNLNDRAQERFALLKKKTGLVMAISSLPDYVKDKLKIEVREGMPSKTVEAAINAHLADKPAAYHIVNNEVKIVDDMFDYISSLNLSPQLSLVMGYLISFNKTQNPDDILKAKATLKEFIYMKGFSG